MSRADELIGLLRSLNVKLWVEGENLRLRAPASVVTPELKKEITEHKPAIIAFLKRAGQINLQVQTITPNPRPRHIPLSFSQERLWFLHQLQPDSAAYNVPLVFRLRGNLNIPVLERSLSTLVERHEILRTSFIFFDGRAYQQIELPQSVEFQQVDAGERWREWIQTESNRPFDLTRGALFRAALLRVAEDDHVLFLLFHHIVTDGWSTGVILRELSSLYSAFIKGGEASLPPLPIQYADFAIWQRNWMQGESLQTRLDYWRAQLKNVPPVIEIPTDHPRPAVQTYRGASCQFPLSSHLIEHLKSFSARHSVTLFMSLLAAFQSLLYRYSSQSEFAVGTPSANRIQDEVSGLIGFFVNTLALRADFSNDPTFLEFLQQVRETSSNAYTHQELPFEKLVDDLRLERDLSRNALFQTMFVLQNTPEVSLSLPGVRVEEIFAATDTSKFDLTFFVRESGHSPSLVIEYSTELFNADTIERMAGHYCQLIESILADPGQKVSRLTMLTGAEREQLLFKWNDTRVEYPQAGILDFFEAQAGKTPEAVALVFEDRQMTYLELNERANQLARELQVRGVVPDALVGVCVERSFEMVVALLGILKSGGAYVPLDPAYPKDRLAFMLEDSNVKVLLTQESLLEVLNLSPETSLLCLDHDWNQIAIHSSENLKKQVTGNNLAYMIYTSGSTGRPKGALNAHEGIFNRLYWMQSEYQLTSDDRVLQKTPFSFDVSVWEFFLPLMFGARLVIARPEGHKDPQYLVELIQREGITTLHFVPSMLYPFLETPGVSSCKSIKRVMCSGETLPVDLANRFFKVLNAELHNLYGPTEAAVDVSYWKCQPDETRHTVPLGKPVANTQLYVLDRHLQPQPIGIPGELHIGGIQVGKGYLNRPELTAEKFIADPFNAGSLYKTGDLCRVMPDGNIEFLGRIDFQVKIRGFRIELGEIESVLANHAFVRQVILTARREPNGQHRLVAYLTLNDKTQTDDDVVSALRAHLKQDLPDYMIPALFVILDHMPLSPNGKIDRKALPEPKPANLRTSEFVPAQNAIEQTLADIWAELLGLPYVGREDNFFELGGDSILSIQFISRAQAKGVYLTPRHVFELQTLASLSRIAEQRNPVHAEQGLVKGDVPLTPIQHWFFETHQANPHHFNQSVFLKTERSLDVDLLTRTLDILFHHHDALRARFEFNPQGWRQWLADFQPAAGLVRRFDLSALDEAEKQWMIQSVNKDLQTSLNISEGPLLRAAFFDHGNGQPQNLLVVIHHLAVDFVSWQILIHDLWTLYDQLAGGQSPRLPEKTSSFKSWAEWLADYANHGKLDDEVKYWLHIGKQKIHPLPMDHPDRRKENRISDVGKVEITLPEVATQILLRDVPGAYHTQINDILLTALAQTFEAWTGQTTLLIDLEGHGRESDTLDLSRTVGWFTSLFPVRLNLSARDPGESIKSIKSQLRQIPQKGMGYDVLRYLNSETSSVFSSLSKAEILFNYGGQLKTAVVQLQGDEQPQDQDLGYLFNINGAVVNNSLVISWIYSQKIYERSTVEKLASAFIGYLRDLIAHCQTAQSGSYLPGDFPLAGLAQTELDVLAEHSPYIFDVYPLSPMQSIILSRSLAAPDSGIYVTQTVFEINHPLDVPRFKQAWRQATERHEILRTCFAWQGVRQPLQIVHDRVNLSWEEQDWRSISSDEQSTRLDDLLRRESIKGFNLAVPPLMRFTIIHLDEARYQFVWHCHHLLVDGWSSAVLIREVIELYDAPSSFLNLSHAYSDYIEWLLKQDMEQAERFWREKLAGFLASTSLPLQKESDDMNGYHEESILFSAELSSGLQAFAQRHRLTLGTLFQGAWALTLRQISGADDVLFGMTVSGRSAPLAGIESRVGLYINTLPLRVRIVPDQPLVDWLQNIMQEQGQLEQYAYTPPSLLERCSNIPAGQPLFNSNLRFQNYPSAQPSSRDHAGLNMKIIGGADWWHYPFNLVIVPDSRVKLSITRDARLIEASAFIRILQSVESVLSRFVNESPHKSLSSFFL